uniref:Uncharacterized protein MANES_02G007400 n=1 Tax=Rhizophora mucronata TaxID=61149 RepID=A0A2P2K894_RHIMU
MEGASRTKHASPLCAAHPLRHAPFNRAFAAIYALAILALLYRQTRVLLLQSSTLVSILISLALLVSDLILAFTWSEAQAVRLYPLARQEFPENLENVIKTSDFPALDVFICSADPYREPPLSVVNTALSVMAYDYPADKLSVFVSDDAGSALTLFAFLEAAKFASHWLPFCRINNVIERCPKAFFESNHSSSVETDKIKIMYESMKSRIEHVVETGNVYEEYMSSDEERSALSKLTAHGCTRQNHPTVIQVLLNNSRDKDIGGQFMPNLVYISREKSRTHSHHFKAGALNVLLRVSSVMTNAPIILTLDCDMHSNDPKTPLRALCYYSDPDILASCAFIQFPQRFKGINKCDIYAGEFKRLFQIQPMGFDGLMGSTHFGTCCFFSRRAFFGSPSHLVLPEIPELCPGHIVKRAIDTHETLALACQVAGCNYESKTDWGSKIGYRYGSLVEDYYTGYLLHCQGWRSMFCNPDRAAFLGDAPMSLVDMLNQHRRWAIGLLEAGFSKYSPLIHGVRYMGPLTGLAYSQYAFWPMLSIPLTVYAFLPQLALINDICILPKVYLNIHEKNFIQRNLLEFKIVLT